MLRPRPRPAFTLVELLIVIIIISMLTGMLVLMIGKARVSAIDARMTAEINQLHAAVEEHKAKYGAYPPDFNDLGRAQRHIKRMFPQYTGTPTAASLSEAEALVYWLGGVPDGALTNASSKTNGWHLDPTNPFNPSLSNRSTPLFQFEQTRLLDSDGNGYYEYYPPHKKSANDGIPPYVYFERNSYVGTASVPTHPNSGANAARPYRRHTPADGSVGANSPWVNPDSFQIICAGQDNDFGPNVDTGFPSLYPHRAPPMPQVTPHDDNLANFTTGRLEDGKK